MALAAGLNFQPSLCCRRLNAARFSLVSQRCITQICRVTNTSEEIYRNLGLKVPTGNEELEEVSIHQTQVLYPELGSLESRVSKFYLDELFANTGPDLEETAYWFHTPDGGWMQGEKTMKAAPEAPVTFADPTHEDWESEGRLPLSTLEEGDVITGVVSDIWLYHGCQIDLGYEFDGLIPMTQDNWMADGVREELMPGDKVTARVHRINRPGLYRWPIQLELLEPSWIAAEHVIEPDEFQPPISHAWAQDQGWDMDRILEETGRTYDALNYLIPQDHASLADEMQQAMGYDVENEGALDQPNPMEERILFEYSQRISHLAAQQMDRQ